MLFRYDHPHVIAGAGCIGIEILEQLPEADAILVPIGGGGLIAGIAAVVKHIKPAVLLYVMLFFSFYDDKIVTMWFCIEKKYV